MTEVREPRYYVGKGKVYISERTPDGKPIGFDWLGNVPQLVLSLEETRIEHKESYTGANLIDKVVGTGQSASGSFAVDEYTQDNLKRFLFGTATDIPASTITAEVITAARGKYKPLSRPVITTFTGLTSNDGAIAYVDGVDYSINLDTGMIYFEPGGAIPDAAILKATYQHGDIEQVSAFTAKPKSYWLRFEGLNQAEDSQPVIIDIFKYRPNPIGSIEMITDEFGVLEIDGMVEYDPQQPSNASNGRFFRVQQTRQVGIAFGS